MHIDADEVTVWWIDQLETRVDEARLGARERVRADSMPYSPGRREFVVGALLLRAAVARFSGRDAADVEIDRSCPDCTRWHGRPRVVGRVDIEVSVTHSDGLIGVAVGGVGTRLGLDVERVARVPDHPDAGLVGLTLDDAELATLGGRSVSSRQFATYWVRKEAVLKATGEGLRRPLTSLRVTAPDLPPVLLRAPGDLTARTTLVDLLGHESSSVAALAAVVPAGARPSPKIVQGDGRTLLE
ncbi:4'-phosphopantetheinyl transferase superfamily protein [Cryobacterium sp. PH29-G1]|uniref:4'-phosphopantetheinyl transferase family protein n=1 Tax=Cryobacterium sp. PH29-G1 TaxID=3046211 RepID=UPI0024BA8B30|nr:4'-phosphopantetheinyl transferase superfamily protein [Cryobacterium sp. PH29-G1]MDJ0349142.1 4'-phosphopantetheinyl transferase superfamily protein [Cryobacterium sp. PH29-G1]